MIKEIIQKVGGAVEIVEEVFDPSKHVDERTQRIRLNKCMGCEHYRKWSGQCKLCWCFMAIKTGLKSKYCEEVSEEYPNGRWQKEE